MTHQCCDRMAADLAQTCDQHPDRFDCPDALTAEMNGGIGLIIHDGSQSAVLISFCPWCGAQLPQADN
jgi:hypothetical protein